MGYYTSFELEWTGDKPVTKPCEACAGKGHVVIDDPVGEFVRTVPFLYGATEPVGSSLEDSVKWYDHEVDMKRLSKEFPNVLFTLHGRGEEAGDVWVKYFKNGKMQSSKAEIKLDKFDESRLQ